MIKPRRGFALAEENYTLGSRTGINPAPTVDVCNTLIINALLRLFFVIYIFNHHIAIVTLLQGRVGRVRGRPLCRQTEFLSR